MKTLFRSATLAISGLALALSPVVASAQDDSEMRPEVYQLLVDCGAANALASSGAEEQADKDTYEGKAVAFWQVAMVYGDVGKEQMKTDGAASLEKVQDLAKNDSDGLTELVTQCIGMEEVVMRIHSGDDLGE